MELAGKGMHQAGELIGTGWEQVGNKLGADWGLRQGTDLGEEELAEKGLGTNGSG